MQSPERRYHYAKRPFCHFLDHPIVFLTESTSFGVDALDKTTGFSGLSPKNRVRFYKNEFFGMFLNFALDSLTVLANMVRIVAVSGDGSGLRGWKCRMVRILIASR